MTDRNEVQIASLNSGSNGNCYYIGDNEDAVLIDAGISCRETVRRMAGCGLDIGSVRAVFLSHEHTDHTRGAEVLSRKYGIPLYVTPDTLAAGKLSVDPLLLRSFSHGETILLGGLTVHPFRKSHDGVDPHSFLVRCGGRATGVFTDIGTACDHLANHFSECHAVFLESNYDERMLNEGPYPLHLKRRIKGSRGHLSNDQALELFRWYRSRDLKLLILSHLSEQNNRPEIVRQLFAPHANGTQIEVASRYSVTGPFRIA